MQPERRRQALDVLLWAGLSLPVAVGLLSPPPPAWWPVRLVVALAAMGAAVWCGRRQPLAAVVIVVVASVVDGNFSFSIPVMSYLLGHRVARAGPAAAAFTAIAVAGTALAVGALHLDPGTWFVFATTLLFAGVFPWLVGRYRRQHRDLLVAGWQRAEQLERERDLVRALERARIARDMHDSLGHELSLIALRAGALEVADLPEAHRRAAAELRASTAAATDRLRDIVGMLRDDSARAPLEPPDESVEALVERARASGLPVDLTVTGGGQAAPDLVRRAAHRVVREALTNAARHSPGTPVTVTVREGGGRTRVEVTNPAANEPVEGGTGLAGLHERVRLTGGTFTAGRAGGTFRVFADLPHMAAAGPPTPPPLRQARRQVRRSLVVALAAPVGIAAVLSLSYYPFASFDSVLDTDVYDSLRVGQERSGMPLPGRQVLYRPDGRDLPGVRCEFYSDGNFPMARATYRLCFRDGRLAAKSVIR